MKAKNQMNTDILYQRTWGQLGGKPNAPSGYSEGSEENCQNVKFIKDQAFQNTTDASKKGSGGTKDGTIDRLAKNHELYYNG